MKRRKLWKTGEDGLCCSSSAIQTWLGPSSLLEERSEIPIVFVCFFCVVGYPPNWGKRPRYIDRQFMLWIMCFMDYDSAHAITSDVSIVETAQAAKFFLADGVIVTGSSTGQEADHMELEGKPL